MTELDELLAFVAAAIAGHARTRQRNGLPVPPLALTVARWAADTARSGTTRQPLARPTETGDRVGMERPLLLTIPGAAVLLSVSERTVRNMIADGRLTPVKIGGATRIRRADVVALVAAPASARFRFRDAVEQKAPADDESPTTDAPEAPAPAAGKSPASADVGPSRLSGAA